MTTIPTSLAERRADLNQQIEAAHCEIERMEFEAEGWRHKLEVMSAELRGIEFAIAVLAAGQSAQPAPEPAKPPREKRRDIRGMVLELVEKSPGLRIAEIAERIAAPPSRVKAAVEYWAGEGKLAMSNSGLVITAGMMKVAPVDETAATAEAAE